MTDTAATDPDVAPDPDPDEPHSVLADYRAYRAGTIDLPSLASIWASRTWDPRGLPVPHDPVDVWDNAEDSDDDEYFEPGTWGEVQYLWASGQLSDDEYDYISTRADTAARARAQATPEPAEPTEPTEE